MNSKKTQFPIDLFHFTISYISSPPCHTPKQHHGFFVENHQVAAKCWEPWKNSKPSVFFDGHGDQTNRFPKVWNHRKIERTIKEIKQWMFPGSRYIIWVVVSNIFYFQPYLGKIPILTNIFQMGWSHQLVIYLFFANFWFWIQWLRPMKRPNNHSHNDHRNVEFL